MSLPDPNNYATWQEFASALVRSLSIGAGLQSLSLGTGSGGGSTGEGTSPEIPPSAGPVPEGYSPVWLSNADALLWLGNNDSSPPPAPALFMVDSANIAEASIVTTKMADNSVGTAKIVNDAITSGKILAGAVTTTKIANLAVTTALIDNAAVVSAKIADANVISAKIADLAVITAKIADAAIVSAKIGDLQVVTAKIDDLAVNTAKMANLAVTSAKIANLAVGTAHIQDAAIVGAKIGTAVITTAHIGAAQITSALIADANITTAKIADGSITNAKIGNAEIQSAKIANLVVDKLLGGILGAAIDVGAGYIRWSNGTVMLHLAVGFGTTNQFIMWFGPTMAANLCSESNGLFWLNNIGDGYFGGTLSAGILSAGNSNPSIATDVVADTGTFGSNGGEIVVQCSWTYTATEVRNYDPDAPGIAAFDADAATYGATPVGGGRYVGSTGFTVSNSSLTLARKVGAGSFANVQTGNSTANNGSFDGRRPVLGDVPRTATIVHTMGISFTFTDTTNSVANRQFTLTLDRNHSDAGSVTQRVSIVTAED